MLYKRIRALREDNDLTQKEMARSTQMFSTSLQQL